MDKITNYINGFTYMDNDLSFFPFSEGRVLYNGSNNFEYEYWMKDHLGNTRLSFTSQESEINISQTDFYYPFGIRIPLTSSGDENKLLYNGKELFDENGLYWYHYGARFYNPQIGQWHTMDPADEFNSPYVYVGNNPVMLVDPDGRQAQNGAEKSNVFEDLLAGMFEKISDFSSLLNSLTNIPTDEDLSATEVVRNGSFVNNKNNKIIDGIEKSKQFNTAMSVVTENSLNVVHEYASTTNGVASGVALGTAWCPPASGTAMAIATGAGVVASGASIMNYMITGNNKYLYQASYDASTTLASFGAVSSLKFSSSLTSQNLLYLENTVGGTLGSMSSGIGLGINF